MAGSVRCGGSAGKRSWSRLSQIAAVLLSTPARPGRKSDMARTRWHAPSMMAGLIAASAIALLTTLPLHSQTPAAPAADASQASGPSPALKGTLSRVKVHGKALEGNLMGESAEPEVSIYL